jgi:hypothetical protein
MYLAIARDDGAVADFDMAGEQGAVNDYDMVPDPAIVGDMAVDHEEIVVADNRGGVFAIAPVNRHAFSENIVIPDQCVGFFIVIPDILGGLTDDGVGKDPVVFAQGCPTADVGAVHQAGSGTDGNIRVDEDMGADFDVVGQDDRRINDCRGMYDGHGASLGKNRALTRKRKDLELNAG